MALDTRYIPVIFPQGLFRDKETGLPLRNGVIYTWEDESRTTPKPLFKISGTPPNYVYTELPNPLDLNSIGSFQDPNTNEDIAPYFFPYDSEDADANIQLYFYEVYSEGGKTSGVLQFTREGQPNLAEEVGPPEQQFENYIPNGQFLSHNDLAALPDGTKEAGEIRAATTVVAQGGWTFDRPENSASKDIYSFDRFPDTYDNPRFAFHIKCESPDEGDTFKDLRVEFRDVNKFASLTQEYTFAFSATDNDGTGLPLELILIKNFGTGGDSPTERSISTFNITSAYPVPPANPYQTSFAFQLNTGKSIGDLNDDYLQLAIRFPVDSAFDVSLTDFSLAQGDITITGFPVQTDADTLTRSVAGWMPVPNPDGSDLYLPLKLTQQGLTFDDGEIGDVCQESQLPNYTNSLHNTTNRMLPDGSQYETAAYSALGIPFARLQSKYYNATVNAPEWGTGPQYFIGVYQEPATTELRIVNNSPGVVTAAASPTPVLFNILTNHAGVSTYSTRCFYADLNFLLLENTNLGAVTSANAGTSGFNFTIDPGGPGTAERTLIEVTTPAGLGGKYFTFVSTNPFYVWFQVDSVGVDPAIPGHLPIAINLRSDYDDIMVANVIREALNAWNITTIRPLPAASISAGAYFTISASNNAGGEVDYVIWYKINGSGTEPVVTGIKIQVTLDGTETAAQVCVKTQTAINKKYFAAPDLRNAFIRSFSDTPSEWLTDYGIRLNVTPGFGNGTYANYELDSFREHNHPGSTLETFVFQGAGGTDFDAYVVTSPDPETANLSVAYQGTAETRPVNVALNFAIKY